MISLIPHILGIACLLYSLQLLRLLRIDFAGKGFGDALMAFAAGILSLLFTAASVIGLSLFLPFDGSISPAMYFIRMSALIPTTYLMAFLASHALRGAIGPSYPQNAVSHTAYLGVTLFFLAPVARTWLSTLSAVIR